MSSFKIITVLILLGLTASELAAHPLQSEFRSKLVGSETENDSTIVNKAGDSWFGTDKGLHLLGSMMLTVAVTKTLQQKNFTLKKARMFSGGFTVSIGIGKETYDSTQKGNHFSLKDLLADGVGILIANLILSIR